MSFNSLSFLVFLPIVVLIYWILPFKFRWAFLLLASCFFYAYSNAFLVFLILGTTLISYLCSIGIEKASRHGLKKLLLILCITLILSSLFVFKYLNFACSSFVAVLNLFGLQLQFDGLNIVLPVGISFYTFQTISYVVDVYRGKILPEHHFGYYALFVSFFPQLVAGPIERSDALLPQLKEERNMDTKAISDALFYLTTGFVKKIVVADFLGTYVTSIYSSISMNSGASLTLATFAFAFQIYGDFSGYSDIAIGCGCLLGIRLTKNFDHPYSSKSVKEFYHRWHITLNSWLTDYIYIPLGGSRKGTPRKVLNILLVFLISGFWHGASWNFVFWGLLNGFYVVMETLLSKYLDRFRERRGLSYVFQGITFLLISSTWIFFRSPDIQSAFLVYSRIFTSFLSGNGFEEFQSFQFFLRFVLSFVLMWAISYLPKIPFDSREGYRSSMVYVALLFLIGFCWINQLQTGGESSFLYFQF